MDLAWWKLLYIICIFGSTIVVSNRDHKGKRFSNCFGALRVYQSRQWYLYFAFKGGESPSRTSNTSSHFPDILFHRDCYTQWNYPPSIWHRLPHFTFRKSGAMLLCSIHSSLVSCLLILPSGGPKLQYTSHLLLVRKKAQSSFFQISGNFSLVAILLRSLQSLSSLQSHDSQLLM